MLPQFPQSNLSDGEHWPLVAFTVVVPFLTERPSPLDKDPSGSNSTCLEVALPEICEAAHHLSA